jgi:two-component system, OmpR family, sensor kinase
VERGEAYAQLLDGRGRVLDFSGPPARTDLLTRDELRAAQGRPIFADRASIPGLDEPSRVLATPIVRRGHRLVLVVGATRENRAEVLDSLEDVFAVAGPIALALATLAGYLLAGAALAPVETMRARAAAVSAETAAERLPVPQTRDELQRLGETLNQMLDRLHAALQRERDFVADAGHELRTPLALVRAELELALRHADSKEELRDALRSTAAEVDRLTQLAGDMLLIASADRGALALRVETLDADALLNAVVSRFEWRAEREGRPVRAQAPPGLQLRGDRLRLEQALGNLVENALHHGAGEVALYATVEDKRVELHVTDEGPGFSHRFLEHAFERFSRDPAARSSAGAGLGLAIVRMIARAHGGSVQAANRPDRGADVCITLRALADGGAGCAPLSTRPDLDKSPNAQ